MLYVLTVAIIILFILSIKKKKDFFAINNTNTIRGLAALCIVAHHIAQFVSIQNGLIYLWSASGFLFVGVFFMLSGYGNYFSLNNAWGKVKWKWLLKRFLSIIIPLLFVMLISFIVLDIEDLSYVKSVITLTQPGWTSWYVKIQLVLYLLLFLIWKALKGNSTVETIVFCILSMILIVLLNIAGYDAYWYNTLLCFAFGVVIASAKEKIKKFNLIETIIITVSLAILFVISFGQYFFWGSYKFDIIIALAFSAIVVGICSIISLNNKILESVGKMSYEIYLSHLIYIRMFMIDKSYDISEDMEIILIVILTAVTSVIIHMLSKKIIKACKI